MAARNEDISEALLDTLKRLGLKRFYPNKLTLHSLLEINKDNVCDRTVSSLEDIPWCFLRNLFKINAECRTCTQLPSKEDDNDPFDLDFYTADHNDKNINVLDLIVALFLCADSYLQQEMALKMSLCQFSVPLLLPSGGSNQCSLMLWSLRDIVKDWRPSDLSESRGFVEDSIVQASMPFYSFVRLKNCSLSKSKLLNHVLSHGQQNQNVFIHRDTEGGAPQREIANGLVEVCWYLPCGRENLDIFPEPVAFANLRGDICESLAQFSFLFQVSTATFVLLDRVEEQEQKILTSLNDMKSKLFFIFNHTDKSAREDMMSVKTTLDSLHLPKSNVLTKDKRVNDAAFSKKLSATIKTSLADSASRTSIENMVEQATELGLSVDESVSNEQKKAAGQMMEGIGVRTIPDYKKQQLSLQGQNWKRLSQLEKEECRFINVGDSGLEEYKSKLQEEKQKIKQELSGKKMSKAMKIFIDNISTSETDKRDFFLKWLKLKLDTHSRLKLSKLRNQFKERCKNEDAKRVAELDQALVESSLGIEHYMREMGLIYEFSLQSKNSSDEISRLPGLAAEMLLDGHPLEVLDGDASNIPERWVSDVLMELHKKVAGKSRLLVLTVLGVQSTGKSTLLNTMFGVQFPVSSGRCTRGAYMVFLRVGEELKSELNYDFIVLIDTEGLKSPHLAQQVDSYEHDNQLATFVIGLSDVTIINIAMENSTEMKDVLQIATHAFLRMKEIGKKPECHFVHQSVGGVSAHSKNMVERRHLLDQLNEMTQIAAEMERQPAFKTFTDVLDYDIDKNNWYIPGLWHGTPPMAPVNTGYSEAVADFKNNLLETAKGETRPDISQIPDFLEWMRGLWRAVKFENFIFSFRNTLVANAYDNLCKEFNQWEWDFRRALLSWLSEAEVEICNADYDCEQKSNDLVDSKKSELVKKIEEQQMKMQQNLRDYYKRKNAHVHLIEKYKMDFFNNIRSLAAEIKYSMSRKLDNVFTVQQSLKEVQQVQRKYRTMIEEQVMKLLRESKEHKLSDKQLTDEFEKMWVKVTEDQQGLQEQDITENIMSLLRKSFGNRKFNEELQENPELEKMGKDPFKARTKHVKNKLTLNILYKRSIKRDLQAAADNAVESCKQYVHEIMNLNTDYFEFYTKELLDKIDAILQKNSKDCKISFEVDLKLHICGFARRKFIEMHKRFLAENTPVTQMERKKDQYLSCFLDLYKERLTDQKAQSQQKAKDFVGLCIKPAVENFVNRSLGIDIVDEILKDRASVEYSSRSFFQYNIQKELLEKENFDSVVKYFSNYERYAKNWIFENILQRLSEGKTLSELKNRSLQNILHKIREAIKMASKGKDGVPLPDNTESITKLIGNMREHLIKDISFSDEDVQTTLFQIQATCHPFIDGLLTSLNELQEQLEKQFSCFKDVSETLYKVSVKPQDELFRRVIGCGKQCPFCKIPCEAGGQGHQQHRATVHRPQGLGGCHYEASNKLVETLCTTDVQTDREFRSAGTKGKDHPYKDYTRFYPDWHIPPDPTIEASDYWKYILVKYNDRLAENLKSEPADVPQAWKNITKEQAMKSLKGAFNIK